MVFKVEKLHSGALNWLKGDVMVKYAFQSKNQQIPFEKLGHLAHSARVNTCDWPKAYPSSLIHLSEGKSVICSSKVQVWGTCERHDSAKTRQSQGCQGWLWFMCSMSVLSSDCCFRWTAVHPSNARSPDRTGLFETKQVSEFRIPHHTSARLRGKSIFRDICARQKLLVPFTVIPYALSDVPSPLTALHCWRKKKRKSSASCPHSTLFLQLRI